MKKSIVLLIIMSIVLSLFTGCKTTQPAAEQPPAKETPKEEEPKEEEPDSETAPSQEIPEEDLELTIASGVIGSSWNVIATTIAGLIEENIEGSKVTVIPGGGAPNIMAVSQNEADLGISYNNIAWSASQGNEPFTEVINVSAVSSFMPYALHVIVSEDTGITSWDDVIEQEYPLRIGVGTRGATGDLTLQSVLKEYGISYDDILKWGGTVEYLSYPDTISLIRDNRLDGMAGFPDVPSSYIVEAIEAKSMNFVEISDEVLQKLIESQGYVRYAIKPETYKGQTEEAVTLGANMILFARQDLSEELVYRIASLIHDNQSKLEAAVASMKQISVESSSQNTGVPLHPGSERYYTEKGVLK